MATFELFPCVLNLLSDMPQEAIVEMNHWGIMIDVTHPSKESIMQTLDLTRALMLCSFLHVKARFI
jgi:microsomal dipeptidase-like Zn-dependent dipeptidase